MRYFIEIAYDGLPYHGWQRQPNGNSVQEEIENAFSTILRTKINIVGAGRTDAGVHAKQLFAHFDIEQNWSVQDCHQFTYRLNRFLPATIAIKKITAVSPDAHARFDATSRSYEYHVSLAKNPFNIEHAYYVQQKIDISAMNEAAILLIGCKDFKCFSRSNTDVKTYICDVTEAFWEVRGDELIFRITANRFLRNMVRAVVGTLLDVGKGKEDKNHIKLVLASKDRGAAGTSAPAHGLYLVSVKYPEEIFL
ncbi:MAG: tRNA pseudouridine(38-40) synthase TruA [Leeuwenhoekiella sp.]